MPSEGVIHANFAKKDTKSAMSIFLKEITGRMILNNIA